ncbi:MAG: DUF1499 domain-containing protein [Myxococcota bacterium]|nr:DUF1499 domain-containing protein [Myxococcota bacterium]MEC8422841.1 DUF1499 domain-containing protein [Myxococcota bacterium]
MSRFAPPPPWPNCVSSRVPPSDWMHHIAPLSGVDLARVRSIVEAMPRTEVVEESDGYMKVVFTTAVLRFKDDVEFEQEGGGVHVRSASRVGRSDFGANRRRVEAIRAALG